MQDNQQVEAGAGGPTFDMLTRYCLGSATEAEINTLVNAEQLDLGFLTPYMHEVQDTPNPVKQTRKNVSYAYRLIYRDYLAQGEKGGALMYDVASSKYCVMRTQKGSLMQVTPIPPAILYNDGMLPLIDIHSHPFLRLFSAHDLISFLPATQAFDQLPKKMEAKKEHGAPDFEKYHRVGGGIVVAPNYQFFALRPMDDVERYVVRDFDAFNMRICKERAAIIEKFENYCNGKFDSIESALDKLSGFGTELTVSEKESLITQSNRTRHLLDDMENRTCLFLAHYLNIPIFYSSNFKDFRRLTDLDQLKVI